MKKNSERVREREKEVESELYRSECTNVQQSINVSVCQKVCMYVVTVHVAYYKCKCKNFAHFSNTKAKNLSNRYFYVTNFTF